MIDAAADGRCRWYVIQTKPRQEARAEANLRRWNIPTLAPKLREDRRSRTGELVHRITPFFSNYLFARFDAEALASKVRLTRGIQRVVGFGEYATPVDDDVIDLIRSRTAEDGIVRPPELRRGDKVEIVDGPLRSLVGVFEHHVPARDRVVVLLTTVGCQARIQVGRDAVRNASRSVAWTTALVDV